MTTPSDTPRTDAFRAEFAKSCRVTWIEDIILEYSRVLERENAELRREVEEFMEKK